MEIETGDLTVYALSEEGQDLIYAPSRRAEVLQATMLRADRPNVTADRITAAITTAHHKATRARVEDPNWARFAGDSACRSSIRRSRSSVTRSGTCGASTVVPPVRTHGAGQFLPMKDQP